ncbi:MAG: alpha/beta hydrolase [Bryobacteraceae bacterium]
MTRVPLLPFDRFPNLTRLRQVRCPLWVVHGTKDDVVPWSHGKRLFARAAEPKQALWVEGGGHNDVVSFAGSRYGEALERFST